MLLLLDLEQPQRDLVRVGVRPEKVVVGPEGNEPVDSDRKKPSKAKTVTTRPNFFIMKFRKKYVSELLELMDLRF